MQQRRMPLFLTGLVLILLAGGYVFLLKKEVPAPQAHVEQPLDPNKVLQNQ